MRTTTDHGRGTYGSDVHGSYAVVRHAPLPSWKWSLTVSMRRPASVNPRSMAPPLHRSQRDEPDRDHVSIRTRCGRVRRPVHVEVRPGAALQFDGRSPEGRAEVAPTAHRMDRQIARSHRRLGSLVLLSPDLRLFFAQYSLLPLTTPTRASGEAHRAARHFAEARRPPRSPTVAKAARRASEPPPRPPVSSPPCRRARQASSPSA